MKWFKAYFSYRPHVQIVDIERFNGKSVWINGRRRSRISSDFLYTPVWSLAKEFIVNKANDRLTCAESNYQSAKDAHAVALDMEEPKEANDAQGN